MQTTLPTNGQNPTPMFNPRTAPLKLLPDQPESWHNVPRDKPLAFDAAAKIILDAAEADGKREDVGAGALDKSALDYAPADGQLVMIKTEQVGNELRPASAPFAVRRAAFVQLCERAGAPSDYMRRLPAMLAKACLNHGMATSAEGKSGMIRLARGEARAIVGARYAPLDDAQMIEVVREAFVKRDLDKGAIVRAVAVGPKTVLRVTWPTAGGMQVRAGDSIERGIDITNGELGNSSIGVCPMIWRLVCSNGMRAWSSAGASRNLHIGGGTKELLETLVDAVPAAINETLGLVDAMRVAVDRQIADISAEFDRLGTSFKLNTSEVRGVAVEALRNAAPALPESTSAQPLTRMFEQVPVTVYDVMNGITAYAQERGTDRRLELEEIASVYLTQRTR